MINKEDFESMKKEMEEYDASRDIVIADSREIVKLSKKVIYSVHRKDLDSAEKYAKEIKSKMDALLAKTKDSELEYSGSVKIAAQEYVEAVAFYEFVKSGSIPKQKDSGIIPEFYLLGIADLTGELVRNAVHAAIEGDADQVMKVKELVSEIFWELSQFDLRNGDLRRKFDGIKYDVKKLEDLVLQLKLKE